MDRKILGERIRKERMRIGMTQEQIAEYIDVSTTYIGFIERGERSVTLEKLAMLANCFHVTIDSLLYGPSIEQEINDNEKKLLFLWNLASPDERSMILSIIEVIVNRKSLPGSNDSENASHSL